MSGEEPAKSVLEDVAVELGKQADKLPDRRDSAVPTRAVRAKKSSAEAAELREQRDVELLREQIEDLAGQAWALSRRYPGIERPEHGLRDRRTEESTQQPPGTPMTPSGTSSS